MKKFFRTYWPFSLNELKSQLAYRGAFYLFILTSLFGSFISYFLWMAIYGSADGVCYHKYCFDFDIGLDRR